jgi:hypothetical protein
MKITNSAIQLYSQHASLEKEENRKSLTIWRSGQNRRTSIDEQRAEALKDYLINSSVKVSLSPQAKKILAGHNAGKDLEQGDAPPDLNLRLLQLMIERITGKKVKMADLKKIFSQGSSTVQMPDATVQHTAEQPPNVGFGLIYESHQSHYESETTDFSAQGKIVTDDGRKINFSTQLSMSREFSSAQYQTVRMGDALKDPLVINFNGKAAELTQTHFSFDLNSDGKTEDMDFVSPGSGFLAVDKNGDNKINDGSELFGPSTGNGFNELASYDSDGNNWIDENDSIYNQLRVWTKDKNGQDSLLSLIESGVGALYLGNVTTPFSVKDTQNNLIGQVRTSGIFVQENGVVGTLQQVDLVT